jgi:hypothetical protein
MSNCSGTVHRMVNASRVRLEGRCRFYSRETDRPWALGCGSKGGFRAQIVIFLPSCKKHRPNSAEICNDSLIKLISQKTSAIKLSGLN